MPDSTDSTAEEVERCAQASCPECGSDNVIDTGMGSGEISSTYARFTYHYKCLDCEHWFTVSNEYDKTKATQSSKDALNQMQAGEMNRYTSIDEIL